jgi:hypothetical protein
MEAYQMQAILFPAREQEVYMEDKDGPISHLEKYDKIYWETPWKIKWDVFPLDGYVYVVEEKVVKYHVTIENIIHWDHKHYTVSNLSVKVKPPRWRFDWENNKNGIRDRAKLGVKGCWKDCLIINHIQKLSNGIQITKFRKLNGEYVKRGQQNHIWVIDDKDYSSPNQYELVDNGIKRAKYKTALSENNLEMFVIENLEKVEEGLKLIQRQRSTDIGRIDLLCKDKENNYVVIELKKGLSADAVIGQISRYMGWVEEHLAKHQEDVRGVIIVGKKDNHLNYASKVNPRIKIKEFDLSIK